MPTSRKIRFLAVLVIVAVILLLDWTGGYLTYHLGEYRDVKLGVFALGADPSGARRPDPNYHHGLTPMRVTHDGWGPLSYTLVTNSLGFKDRTPRDVPPQSTGRRLMFIGDSFTEGMGFPYEQTWVGLVDQALAQQGIEVLNAGVSSYCPKTVYYKTKALLASGLRVDHIVFFVDVSDLPDEIIFNDFIPANKDPDDQWSGRYIQTPYSPRVFEYSLTLRSILRQLGRDPWRETYFTDPQSGETFLFRNFADEREGWTRGAKPEWLDAAHEMATYYVTKLIALCKTHGIDFEIAIYPWPQEIAAGDEHSRYRELWRAYCVQHHIFCYDLHDAFFPADPVQQKRILAQDFIAKDVHWTVAGHQLVADEWLRQYSLRHSEGAEVTRLQPDRMNRARSQ